jgi:hypothetical protein
MQIIEFFSKLMDDLMGFSYPMESGRAGLERNTEACLGQGAPDLQGHIVFWKQLYAVKRMACCGN